MTTHALHSDHINYLILRYLQEHGHENAAIAFHKDWHRPYEFRDPESLPFAPIVERDALISVVQDGLFLDELASRSRKVGGRKWKWVGVSPRTALDEEGLREVLEEGEREHARAVEARRPAAGGKRKGRPPKIRNDTTTGEDFPLPSAKRQRKSEGSEPAQVNGEREGMEVDERSPSATAADGEEDAEVASPAFASEPDVVDVPQERYDSMDVATQTEVKTGPKTSTMYWKLDKPDATVLHSLWNPSNDAKSSRTLLTVGDSLCRFYDVPESFDDPQGMDHLDDPNMPAAAVVTASAWHPEGHTASCAVDTIGADSGKKQLQVILNHSRDHATTVFSHEIADMNPPGIVVCMRYSPDGKHILVVRTNQQHGIAQVWSTTPYPEALQTEPIAWHRSPNQLLDGCWLSNDRFILAGSDGTSNRFGLAEPQDAHVLHASGNSETWVQHHGLGIGSPMTTQRNITFDKVRHDEHSGVVVLASSEGRQLTAGLASDSPIIIQRREFGVPLPGTLTGLAFQPQEGVPAGNRACSILAATSEEGFCVLYRLERKDAADFDVKVEELATLELTDGPALALAWSPQGTHLAFGGTDVVQVYEADTLLRKENGTQARPLVTWRADPGAVGKVNGEREHESEDTVTEPSLSWSADGESLGFAHERQLAVIRFRPPLHSAHDSPQQTAVVVNGGGSP